MGLGISRWNNMASCGPFRRTTSELQDPSNYTRLMVDNDNHDKASASTIVIGSKATSQGENNSSSLPKDVVVGSSLPRKDVVNEEKKSTYVDNKNVYQQEEEETERISDYDGPMFMKSPSFRDFVRPIDRLDSVKNGGKKEEKPKENKEIEAHGPNYVCTGEVCTRVEYKNETPVENKEAGPGKEKRVYKVFSQYYKPNVSGGVKSLFHHHHPKQLKNSD